MKLFLRYFARYTLLLVAILVAIPSIVAGSVTGGLLFARFKDGYFANGEIGTVWKACSIAVGGSLIVFGALWLRWRYFSGQDRPAKFFRLTPSQNSRQRRWVWIFNALIYGGGMAVLLWHRTEGTGALRVLEVAAWIAVLFFGLHGRILIHELGHLVAGRSVGITPMKLQVGTGRILFSERWPGALLLEWRIWPGGGLMETFYFYEKGHRWRYWVMVLGGPLANVALVLLDASWLLGERWRWPEVEELGAGQLVLAALAWWTAMLTVVNFIPFKTRLGDRAVHSDGWQLMTLWRLPQAKVIDRILYTSWQWIDALYARGQRERAWELQRQLAERYPQRETVIEAIEGMLRLYDKHFAEAFACYEKILNRADQPRKNLFHFQVLAATCLAQDGQDERARKFCEDTLAAATPEERIVLLDGFASLPVFTGNHRFLGEASRWSEEAVRLAPEKMTVLGTRGSLLAEEGRLEEGEELLRRVCSSAIPERERGIAWFYRAVIAQRRGQDKRKVRRLCLRAGRMCAELWMRERIRTLLDGSSDTPVDGPAVMAHPVA